MSIELNFGAKFLVYDCSFVLSDCLDMNLRMLVDVSEADTSSTIMLFTHPKYNEKRRGKGKLKGRKAFHTSLHRRGDPQVKGVEVTTGRLELLVSSVCLFAY